MGAYDSSQTRVAPVFERLLARDPSGAWLPELLELPERFDGTRPARPSPAEVGALLDWGWHPDERELLPPRSLLLHLVEHPGELRRPKNLGTRSDATRERRRLLLSADQATLERSRRLLVHDRLPAKAWYIFEGPTFADAYLAAEQVTVLVEGKRKERGPTTKTEWMKVRHQVLRNLDCVIGEPARAHAFAFFAVEGSLPDPLEVPTEWRAFSNASVTPDALGRSLPHRTPDEQRAIADGFLGVTTWQRICRQFGICWEDLPDRVMSRRTTGIPVTSEPTL